MGVAGLMFPAAVTIRNQSYRIIDNQLTGNEFESIISELSIFSARFLNIKRL